MTCVVPITLSDRFASLIAGTCAALAARCATNRAMAPAGVLLWGFLRRMAVRFAAQVARAGETGPPARPRAAPSSRAPRPPGVRKPGGFRWLYRLMPEAPIYASQLQAWLADPEVADLLAAAPQAGGILRSLCRTLGVRPLPDILRPAVLRPAVRTAPLPEGSAGAPADASDAAMSSARDGRIGHGPGRSQDCGPDRPPGCAALPLKA